MDLVKIKYTATIADGLAIAPGENAIENKAEIAGTSESQAMIAENSLLPAERFPAKT